ncbi:MAG: hypothetical protein AABZ47_07580, partial [Planctomycetota bacterium]
MKKRFFLSLLILTESSALAQFTCPAVKYDWSVPAYAGSLAVDSQGDVYAADPEQGVSKRSPSGDLLWTYAPTPYLWALAVDPQDNVYITQTDRFYATRSFSRRRR